MDINSDVLALSDDTLVARIVAGEKQLFEVFMKKYNTRLYRVSMSIIHDDDEAEDIMQAAYIKAYENLNRFEGRSNFLTWLTRIAINEGLMRLKKRKRHTTIDTETLELPADQAHPMGSMINEELKQILEKAIAQLPSKYRMVFMMREIEGMSTAETTQCLALTETNVKVRLNRAKEMLRESLSHYAQSENLYSFHLIRCGRIRDNVMRVIMEMK